MTVLTMEGDLAARLLHGLRVAQCVIVLAILVGRDLLIVVIGRIAFVPQWAGIACWGVLVAIALADGVLVVRRRLWGRARWPVAIVVLGVSVAMVLTLYPVEVNGPAHITLWVAGWVWVLLFTGSRPAELVTVLVVHLLIVLGALIASGRADPVTLVSFATAVVAVSAFQLTVGLAGSALRTIARRSTEAALEEARARTSEDIASAVHADRQERYVALRAVALPLLTGIGDGSAPPSDPAVQRAAAAAAARLRRMFGEEGEEGDALAAELGELVDIAERRGIAVRYSERGPRRLPPSEAARQMLVVAGAALHATQATARVTLAGVGEDVVLGVVTDGTPTGLEATEVALSVVEGDGLTWVEMRWAPGT